MLPAILFLLMLLAVPFALPGDAKAPPVVTSDAGVVVHGTSEDARWDDGTAGVPAMEAAGAGAASAARGWSAPWGLAPDAGATGPADAEATVPADAARGAGVSQLVSDVARILDAPRWPRAQWGVLAVSFEQGDTLFARGADEALIPASNVKLLTTAAAIHHLGAEYRFPTFLLSDAPVEDGVLRGDLVLYGTGDPALSDRFFDSDVTVFREMARALVEQGVHTVEGDLVGDGTFFNGPSLGPEWNQRDLNDWFAAPVTALSFNENVVTLRVTPGSAPGEPAVVHTLPVDAGVPIVNQARTVPGAPRRPIWASRRMPEEPIIIEGELSTNSADVWRVMTVHDPPLYAGTVLRRVLEEEGITIMGGLVTVRSEDDSLMRRGALWAPGLGGRKAVRILATHYSPPLIDLLGVVNRASHNLYAELIWMTLGRLVTGEGSFRGGAEAVVRFLEGPVGVEPGSVVLVDGSGLSRHNRVSAGAFVETMAYMSRGKEWDAFLSSLPAAGDRRGLGRMYRTAAQGNLRAKTGTIDRVSALSGTVLTADGERVGFSILSNEVPSTSQAKRIEDLIGVRLATYRRPAVTADH
ncbi:MAG: D-alanyl-D-alanine carboxypeptidase/D-alanyl-D-alanine-endopeptidase [Gemmatimonadota bacterium]